MKYVRIESVEPGQHLGKTVYSANGTVLLAAGVQLTVFMINTLNRIGVTMLYIQDPAYDDVNTDDILSDATKQVIISEMNDTFESIRSGKDWSTKKLAISISRLMEDIMLNSHELLIQLTDIRTEDNNQYVHAMNVCLISTVIGLNMGLNYNQLRDLAIGALLHDAGKIGEKAAAEAADASLKGHHTWRGFELLKAKHEFNLLIAHIALQHHEQIDGRGLPRGLMADGIHTYAKIVAVANCYDNFINPLGGNLLPHEACERLMAMSEKQLDHEVLVQFTRIISVYPNGIAVRLSTNETGIVVRQHRGLPGRPVVRVVRRVGDELDVTQIDLAEQTTVFIEAVLT